MNEFSFTSLCEVFNINSLNLRALFYFYLCKKIKILINSLLMSLFLGVYMLYALCDVRFSIF